MCTYLYFEGNVYIHEVKQRLNDWFNQEAQSFFSPKCNLYKCLNNNFQLQPYLTKSISEIQMQYIGKYRLSVRQLELEPGRFEVKEYVKTVHWEMLKMSFISF